MLERAGHFLQEGVSLLLLPHRPHRASALVSRAKRRLPTASGEQTSTPWLCCSLLSDQPGMSAIPGSSRLLQEQILNDPWVRLCATPTAGEGARQTHQRQWGRETETEQGRDREGGRDRQRLREEDRDRRRDRQTEREGHRQRWGS